MMLIHACICQLQPLSPLPDNWTSHYGTGITLIHLTYTRCGLSSPDGTPFVHRHTYQVPCKKDYKPLEDAAAN
jgi:hypothetical protein